MKYIELILVILLLLFFIFIYHYKTDNIKNTEQNYIDTLQ